MNAVVLALCIGIVAGLRALTAPALVSWAAHLGWLHLEGTPLAFMGSTVAVAIFTVLALVEYVTDLLPKTPPRTAPPGLIARLVTGTLSGACLSLSGGASLLLGAVLGAIGAVIGTFGGYKARSGLVKALNVKDIFIAIPEDLIAIGLGYLLVSR
jgi:uncharacterized membrane protein